jgi:hypothetical protein
MDREHLIALVRQIMAVDPPTEEEQNRLIHLFEANVPRPGASDLIFWPKTVPGVDRELSAEEVVDLALSYKPIALGPGPSSSARD